MWDDSHPAICLFPEIDITFIFTFRGSTAAPFSVGSRGVRIGVVLGYSSTRLGTIERAECDKIVHCPYFDFFRFS